MLPATIRQIATNTAETLMEMRKLLIQDIRYPQACRRTYCSSSAQFPELRTKFGPVFMRTMYDENISHTPQSYGGDADQRAAFLPAYRKMEDEPLGRGLGPICSPCQAVSGAEQAAPLL
ncbi:hypothetical protein ASG57_09825 [Bradyrhizobium sp. Leaf396]|nr:MULTISPECIES: hypothetical protein [Bradyrhizobium]KQT08445.1 hypothetical protein ASG57_09825 [Bradyrhizobium sp. Leaf396]